MKIAPLTTTDPWFSHVFNHGKAYVESLVEVPVEVTVLMEQVSFLYGGAEENFRPRLHLQGQVTGLQTPQVELPYGVHEMEFTPGTGPAVDAFYEFSNRQLAKLVMKGYFERGFETPAAMQGVPWVLPATARMVFVAPETMAEPPVVFLELDNANELQIDQVTSGYELTAYFPDHAAQLELDRREREAGLQVDGDQLDGAAHDGSHRDLFEGSELEQGTAQEQTMPDAVFAQLDGTSVENTETLSESERLYRANILPRLNEPIPAAAHVGRHRLVDTSAEGPELVGDVVADISGDGLIKQGISLFDDGFLVFEMDDTDLDFDEDDGISRELEPEQRASFIRAREEEAAREAAAQAAQEGPTPTPERPDSTVPTTLVEDLERSTRRAQRDRRLSALQAEKDALASDRSRVPQPGSSEGVPGSPQGDSSDLEF